MLLLVLVLLHVLHADRQAVRQAQHRCAMHAWSFHLARACAERACMLLPYPKACWLPCPGVGRSPIWPYVRVRASAPHVYAHARALEGQTRKPVQKSPLDMRANLGSAHKDKGARRQQAAQKSQRSPTFPSPSMSRPVACSILLRNLRIVLFRSRPSPPCLRARSPHGPLTTFFLPWSTAELSALQ